MAVRQWLYYMLLIEVKGHANMSPRQNFGRGASQKGSP